MNCALELDESNWELDTSLWKTFVLELNNSHGMDVIHWSYTIVNE